MDGISLLYKGMTLKQKLKARSDIKEELDTLYEIIFTLETELEDLDEELTIRIVE